MALRVVKHVSETGSFTSLRSVHKINNNITCLTFNTDPKYVELVDTCSGVGPDGNFVQVMFDDAEEGFYQNSKEDEPIPYERYEIYGLNHGDLQQVVPLKHEYKIFLIDGIWLQGNFAGNGEEFILEEVEDES